MSSKVVSRKRSKRKSRQLQALRDFTAADTCYSDGANPLSFHIGEIFTFLSRRDNYWVNVERTVQKHNPLLKTKDYSAIERGIVPLDYVIEMDTKQNEGMPSLPIEDDYPALDGDESQDNIFRVSLFKNLCGRLVVRVACSVTFPLVICIANVILKLSKE